MRSYLDMMPEIVKTTALDCANIADTNRRKAGNSGETACERYFPDRFLRSLVPCGQTAEQIPQLWPLWYWK